MSDCIHPDLCGQPRNKTGKAPKGWVKANVSGQPAAWYCGPDCAYQALTGRRAPAQPAPVTPPTGARHDVADCPLCVNRHDRQHRCGVCNTQPQIVRPAPRPVQLFDHARRDLAGTTRKEPA